MKIIERSVYTHYILTGTVVKVFMVTQSKNSPLYFIKIRDEDGKNYDINVPYVLHTRVLLGCKTGQTVSFKIEGYQKGGIERYLLILDAVNHNA